jgi:DNA-binding LacI/PurR family transcriptional regulator
MNEKDFFPPYLIVESAIRKKIEKGVFKQGEKLPPESELASQFKISRTTLRKSFALLKQAEYIYQIPGRGTFVTSPDNPKSSIMRTNYNNIRKMNSGIGLLISCVTGSLYPPIIRGAEDFCRENGYHLVLGNYDAIPEREKEYMERFFQRGISGLIIAASYNSDQNSYYRTLKEKDYPFVVVDTLVRGVESDFVGTNNINGAYLATKMLIEQGCKNILFLSGWLFASSSQERLTGYQYALKEYKLPLRKSLVREGDFSEDFGYKAAKKMFSEEKIDGIFSANEPIAIGVLKAIKERKCSVPEEIKIASFDKLEIPQQLNIPFIVIKQPRYAIGRTAAQILIERIKEKRRRSRKKEVMPYKKILLDPEIVESYGEETQK